ncbi:cysteine protease XCP1-like [Eucalyptus grandis]|uniref:cysteine protease XCP1-like n=1 Tax=Eucalyptus grandis TaxID=71139 RepID=UPI00192EB607|nr:cysteine protease XCP1-like [Eucalyptus grandis]
MGLKLAKNFSIWLILVLCACAVQPVNRTHKVGLNKFSDLTNEEFVAAYTGYKLPSSTRRNSSQVNSFKYQGSNSIPESVNWVKQGAVNPIKNQGQCGSCWFSVVAAVEAITQITTGVLPNLSEQQLIDCATDGNQGCQGGWMDNGFEYIINNNGISSETNYPYVGVDSTCDVQASSVAEAKISDYRDVPRTRTTC